ncbi:MAG: helix-turn-helix transcriptional regulator [Bacteroidales bacterium]|nr:helix-turn-helix transcriptional regulator [Bacteroidales bacterium]
MKTCGKYVKEMRRQYGLTQEQLAMKAGVGLRFLRELESDKPTIRMDKVNMVLEMFGAELGVVSKNNITEQ